MAKAGWLRWKKDDAAADPSEAQGGPGPEQSEQSTERERALHSLAVLSLFLHSTATIEEMMAMLLEQAPEVTGAVLIYPLLLERKRRLLRASVLEGCNDPRLEAAMQAFQEDLTALEFSLVQNDELYRILDGGEVALRDDFSVLMDGVLDEEQWRAGQQALGVRQLALVPMVVENEPLGMVVFAFDRAEVDVDALELLVGHVTLALRALLVRDEAVRFSDVDPMTWVYNRRYLMQALESEIMRAGRYGRGLSLVTLDIDGFGKFNATYGQSHGDRLLLNAAMTLAESVSPPEIVARLKDDEFAVLLPETNRAAAVMAVARLLASLSQVSVFSEGDDEAEPVTFSVAIDCFPEDAATAQALVERAMADLATAKQERTQDQKPSGGGKVDPAARAAARGAA